MKRRIFGSIGILAAVAALIVGGIAFAADVESESTSVSFIRGTATQFATPYFEGTTLRVYFQCFSDTEGIVTQDLTSVTSEVRVGSTATNVPYTPTITNATAGQGYVDIDIPYLTNVTGTLRLQYRLDGTNDGGTTYIYPLSDLTRSTPLQ